ncbi:MAG: BON domain-containing protein [Planctomycetales bacterium]|nr:BON domain-containing protein [Planctomycetales bacterium]
MTTHTDDAQSANLVRQTIDGSQLQAWSRAIDVKCEQGTATLRGTLPSFYYKQLLQTLIRDLPGIKRVDNFVEVRTK